MKFLSPINVDGYVAADHLKLSQTTAESVNIAEIVWNAVDGTFDMGLLNGVTLQSGQEMHFYGKASGAIANGQAVMFAGSEGDHILMAVAEQGTINANPEYFIGIATQDFTNNQFGYVTVLGKVRGLDTTVYASAVLYYNSNPAPIGPGLLTATQPEAPYAKISVAAVIRIHATQGILMVRPHIMPRIKDLQDVYAPSPSNNNGLFWNSATLRYETKSIPTVLGYTPQDAATAITTSNIGSQSVNYANSAAVATNADYANSAGYAGNAGTLDGYDSSYFAVANHTHIISPVVETLVPQNGISIQAGPGGGNGAYGWEYPYGTRLSAITGAGRSFEIMSTTYPGGELVMRTLGSGSVWDPWKKMLDTSNYSGYSNFSGAVYGTIYYDANNTSYYIDPASTSNLNALTLAGTFSAPGYNKTNWDTAYGWGNHALAGYVPQTRTITINGVGYDLSANRSWTISATAVETDTLATVTARGATTSTALNLNGNVNFFGQLGVENQGTFARFAFNKLTFWDWQGSVDVVTIDGGYLEAANSLRAPIFYDSNNTGYYVDPASTSNLNLLTMANKITVGSFPNSTTNNGEAWLGRAADRPAGTMTVQLGGNLDRKFEVVDYGWTTVNFFVNGYGVAEASGSMRAPIFYDSNNTGYYIDGASTSNLAALYTYSYQGNGNVGGTGAASWHPSGIYCGSTMWQYGDMYKNNSSIYDIYNGFANSSLRAPIFYDNNNTGYYIDPAGNSQVSAMYANNWFRAQGNTGLYGQDYGVHFYPQTGSAWSITGSGGNIELQFRSNHNSTIRGYVYADTSNNIGFLTSGGGWRLRCDDSGNAIATGDVTAYSDRRVKENIHTIDNALDKVNNLRGVYYTRIDSEDKQRKVGVIAQETLEVLPEVVGKDTDGMYNVAYGNITALLIEGMKEQQKQIDELKQLVNQLINK